MNLQQLETFRLVAKLGSFTRAAQVLNATQSTISMRVAQLEHALDRQLLDRSQRTVRLTAAGRNMLRYAEQFHKLAEEMQHDLAAPHTMTGLVRIGVAELIALTWLPLLVADLNAHYPKLEVDIEVGLGGSMYERVRNGELDVCLHPIEERAIAGIDAVRLGKIRFAFMASPRLGLPKRHLRPDDISRWPLISFGPESMLSDMVDGWFAKAGCRPVALKRSNSMEVSAGLVRSGLGVSLLPATYYAGEAKADRMRILSTRPQLPPVSFFAISSAGNTSPLVQHITDTAKSVGAFDA